MSAPAEAARHGVPLLAGRDTAPAYWAFGVLWVVLVDSARTGGSFSVMEQWMPAGDGPPAHVHPIDEWFEVLEGDLVFHVGGQEITAGAGDSVWIPRGTVHTFTVLTASHVLNGYTPGGFEQVIKGLGTPAPRRELPPPDLGFDPRAAAQLMDNFWSASADAPWARSWTSWDGPGSSTSASSSRDSARLSSELGATEGDQRSRITAGTVLPRSPR